MDLFFRIQAYNYEEAHGEAKLLTSCGANLIMGAGHNPWGSLLVKTEPNRIFGHFVVNGWIAGAFK